MGIDLFAASAKMPGGTNAKMPNEVEAVLPPGIHAKMPLASAAKMPSPRISAAERLRRLEEAQAFLHQHLTAQLVPARVLIKDAKAASIASRTLHRAKDVLGVHVQRQGWGQGGQWLWAAPAGQAPTETKAVLTAGAASRHTP